MCEVSLKFSLSLSFSLSLVPLRIDSTRPPIYRREGFSLCRQRSSVTVRGLSVKRLKSDSSEVRVDSAVRESRALDRSKFEPVIVELIADEPVA